MSYIYCLQVLDTDGQWRFTDGDHVASSPHEVLWGDLGQAEATLRAMSADVFWDDCRIVRRRAGDIEVMGK